MSMLPTVVYAQFQSGNITVDRPPGFQVTDVGTIISGAIGAAFIISGLIIFAFLVFGGVLMITSSGDKSQTERGRNAITGAAVGFAIIASAYALVLLLQFIFGYQVLGGIEIPQFF